MLTMSLKITIANIFYISFLLCQMMVINLPTNLYLLLWPQNLNHQHLLFFHLFCMTQLTLWCHLLTWPSNVKLAPAFAAPIPHDPALFKLLPAAEIMSILKPIKTGILQHATNFAAFALHDTAALQKQFCFKPPPSNKIAFACKFIVYTQSHEEKIKSLEAQLAAL